MTIKTTYLKLLFLLCSMFNLAAAQATEPHLIGSHGMVLINDKQAGSFVSHLPLYRSPHNYQIIYKVQLPQEVPIEQLAVSGMVTVLPDNFDLNRLVNGESFTINAKFFQGHFERGGQLSHSAKLTFVSAVLVKKVAPTQRKSNAQFYTVAINNNQAIFAHIIQPSPSFDAIGFMPQPNNLKTIQCAKPAKLDLITIRQQLKQCGFPEPAYIETQDFKS